MNNIHAFPTPKTLNKEQYTRLSYQILHQTCDSNIIPTQNIYDVWSAPNNTTMKNHIKEFAHTLHATPSDTLVHILSKYGTTIHEVIELLWTTHPANTNRNNPYINDTRTPSHTPDQHYKV